MSSSELEIWSDRVLCALADLDAMDEPADIAKLRETVAARFGAQFVAGPTVRRGQAILAQPRRRRR